MLITETDVPLLGVTEQMIIQCRQQDRDSLAVAPIYIITWFWAHDCLMHNNTTDFLTNQTRAAIEIN